MGEIVVKHFKRTAAGSGDKELVTEIVLENSDTGRFLQRLEESRLTRPCFQTIDMRGRVAGECRRYAFNDRIHYLDDISFQMFERGLLDNNGVYTVGTFEAIVGGAHTLQAQVDARAEAQRRRDELEQRRLERARAAREPAGVHENQVNAGAFPAQPVPNPDRLTLGYFRRRAYPRLLYACPVTLERGNIRSSGVTRDLSVDGLRVQIKGLTTFRVGEDLLVGFSGLAPEGSDVVTTRIPYRVVRIEPHERETALCLQRPNLEKPAGFTALIENLVERYQQRYKLDVKDEYRSILSWVYERSYAQSAVQIPLFVEQTDAGDLRVQALAMSAGNAQLARFFCTGEDSYNFTPFCLPHRLACLNSGRSYVLAMYRERGQRDECMRIHSAADIEFESAEAFHGFVMHAMQQSDHCIVKVCVGAVPASPLPEKKLDEVSQRLQYKSDAQMVELRARLARLHLVGSVTDVTRDYARYPGSTGPDTVDASVWVGGECRRLASDEVTESLSLPIEDLNPDLIRFGYVERRREDRYLAETRVQVNVGGQVLEGMTRDISTHGMRIELDGEVAARKGLTVKVGLVSLQQKKSATNLMDIPYRVVASRAAAAGTELRLERVLGGRREGLKEFFVELITKNQHKLGVDVGDIWSATASRVYESLFAANTPGIPFFIGRNNEGGAHLQFVGLTESAGALTGFFGTGDGPDFRCLNEPRLVSACYDAVQILLRHARDSGEAPPPFELELYVYRDFDELSGETFVHAASELDFDGQAHRDVFLKRLTTFEQWRCFKLSVTFIQSLDDKVLDKMLELVRTQSRHRAIKLSDVVHSLVGYGEMVDISREWAALRPDVSGGRP